MKGTFTAAAVAASMALTSAILHSQEIRRLSPGSEPTWESCEDMHAEYAARFESTRGFGLSRMAQPPMLDRSGVLDLGRTHYSIESIELVGLLQRDAPVVYAPAYHGQTVDSIRAKTRTPNDFERAALTAFRAGDDLAISDPDASGTMRCVGSLRAKHTCVQCHQSKKEGDVLGAFTYRLRSVGRD